MRSEAAEQWLSIVASLPCPKPFGLLVDQPHILSSDLASVTNGLTVDRPASGCCLHRTVVLDPLSEFRPLIGRQWVAIDIGCRPHSVIRQTIVCELHQEHRSRVVC